MRKVFIASVALLLSGCGAVDMMNYNQSLNLYQQVAPTISLGQSKSEVLGKLAPVQAKTPAVARRAADQLTKEGKRVEIHYVRTAWVADGGSTDDEYTPYVFIDDTLAAVGWAALGGPKTRANHERAAQQKQQGNFLQNLGKAIYQDGVRRQEQQSRRQAPRTGIHCTTTTQGVFTNTDCY